MEELEPGTITEMNLEELVVLQDKGETHLKKPEGIASFYNSWLDHHFWLNTEVQDSRNISQSVAPLF
ncbi:hypothetical protein [Rossellomorea sp. LjRoot5]|uniref:hypothetical protein n=1 Tax=Rossellomorea sp. LjRoot5 TaxID=3342331 RepID=UPI003ECD29EA